MVDMSHNSFSPARIRYPVNQSVAILQTDRPSNLKDRLSFHKRDNSIEQHSQTDKIAPYRSIDHDKSRKNLVTGISSSNHS